MQINPVLLNIVSGEFSGLLSDYLMMKAAVIIGGKTEEMSTDDWNVVYMLYDQSVLLDPWSYSAAYYIQGTLAWRKEFTAKSIDLLQTIASHRSWHWVPKWFVAFDYFQYLKDLDQAAKVMTEAAGMPNAPPIIGSLAARLSLRNGRGDTLAAIAMLKSMYNQTDREDYKKSLDMRIRAYVGVYEIQQALDKYKSIYNHYPEDLNELLNSGLLAALPQNPYAKTFIYDPKKGAVYFDERHL